MRHTALPLVALLCACVPATLQPVPAITGTPGQEQAFFAQYPGQLLDAAAAACSTPGQTMIRPTQDEVLCETLPTYDAAAALILSYDGMIEDLPRFVTGFAAVPTDGGYVVTTQNYIRVPRRALPPVEIRLRDAILRDTMQGLLRAAGGTVISPQDS